jgi:glycosyltransferase involved in cell wall biosynthesis
VTDGGAASGADLRVAVVLGSSTGGIGRHVFSLVAGVRARGVQVTVYGPAATLEHFAFAATGVRTVALEIPDRPGVRDARAVGALRTALRADPVDLVHAHGLRAGLVCALARPGAVPLVVTWHNMVLGRGMRAGILRAGERLVARSATLTLGASDDLVARVTELGGRDVRLGAVAAPARPVPRRDAAQVRRELDAMGRPLIVSVGRLHPQKGYDVLVAAATRWRSLPGPPLVVIAGTGPSYRALAALILRERAPVRLLGYRDDVADLLGAADVAVVSSVWEARQLFAQEALAAGVPLVATQVGGVPGLVGDAAVLVPPGDVEALDAAVRSMLDDPRLRQQYARAGRERAAGWPTEQDSVAQVLDVYAELAARRAERPLDRGPVAQEPAVREPAAGGPALPEPMAATPGGDGSGVADAGGDGAVLP